MMDDDLSIVRGYATDAEGELACAVLAAHGIEALLVRDSASGMIPSLNVAHPVRVAVPTHLAAEAAEILDGGSALEDDATPDDGTAGS
jgi:hypothetical protein